MKKIISIDVGIKNLAFCKLKKNSDGFSIENWDIINILDEKLSQLPKCDNYIKDTKCQKQSYNYIEINEKKIFFCDKVTCKKIMLKKYPDKKIKTNKKVSVKTTSILELSSILLKKLHNIKDKLLDVDEIIIENQPVLKNPTMKSIQMILYTFFIEHGYNNDSQINNIHHFQQETN